MPATAETADTTTAPGRTPRAARTVTQMRARAKRPYLARSGDMGLGYRHRPQGCIPVCLGSDPKPVAT